MATDYQEDVELVSGRSQAKNVSIPWPDPIFLQPRFPTWCLFQFVPMLPIGALHIQRLEAHT